MNEPSEIDVLRAEIHDLRGRMIATEFAIKALITQRLDWKAVHQNWQAELTKMVDTMTEGSLSNVEQTSMLDHLGRFSTAVQALARGDTGAGFPDAGEVVG